MSLWILSNCLAMELLMWSTLCLLCVECASVFSMHICKSEEIIDMPEKGNTTVRCNSVEPSNRLNWNIVNGSTGYQLTSCGTCGTCPKMCCCAKRDVQAIRYDRSSDITFINPRRKYGGQDLQCTSDGTVHASCKLRVVHAGELRGAYVTLHDNGTVTGSVLFSKVFASDNRTVCRWYDTQHVSTKWLQSTTPGNVSAYSDGNTWYFRGKCDVEITLPSVEGPHNISVEILPGKGQISAGTVYLERPGNLTALNNTCPAYVAEGRDVRCQCGYLPAQQGSPPATVSWEHDTTSEVLELDNVKRQHSGNVYRCRSEWGAEKEINAYFNYTFQVMYGPDSATIDVSNAGDPVQNTTLTCTSDDVFPAANFSWSVSCLNETWTRQSSSCAVTPEVITKGTEVVCIVYNSKLPKLNSTAVFKIREINDEIKTDATVQAIASGIGSVAFVTLVVIVIIVIVRKCRDKTYDKPRRRRQPSHKYLDLHHGTHTASTPSQQISSGEHNITALTTDADNLTPMAASASASNAVPDYTELTGKGPVSEHSATYVNQLPAPDSEQSENHYYSQVKDPVSAGSKTRQQAAGEVVTDASLYEVVK